MAQTQRIGTWILGEGGLNLKLVKYEERPDKALWKDGPLYRIKDVFSVMAGSWELTPGTKYSIDEWARNDYWQGAKWSSTGDHNFHIMVLNKAGVPLVGKGILFRQNDWNWQPENLQKSSLKGDSDVYLFNSYAPMRGELGSWIGTTIGRADALAGVDMPLNEHVTVFMVLQESDEAAPPDPDPDPEPTGDLVGVVTAINGLTAQVKRLADHLGAA
jgi:hypothetical protein